MYKTKLNYKLINFTVLVFLIYILTSSINIWWGIVSKCITILLPFIIGFVFAYVFNPIVKFLVKKGIKKSLAVIIIVLGLILLVGGVVAVTFPMVYEQLFSLINMIVKAFNTIDTKYDIGPIKTKIMEYLNGILVQMGNSASSSIGIISKSFDFVGKFIVGFVGFIYFLADMDKIKEGFAKILLSFGKKWFDYFKLMDIEISNYLKGIEIFMFIQLIEYSLVYFLVGHPNWLILGILACITTVIPYFGGFIINTIAVITASVVSVKLVIGTLLICMIFPQFDGYFVSPKIYGKTNKVNPLITIMVVSVGGTVGGAYGMVAALPCYLLLRTTYNFFKKDIKKGMGIVKKTI